MSIFTERLETLKKGCSIQFRLEAYDTICSYRCGEIEKDTVYLCDDCQIKLEQAQWWCENFRNVMEQEIENWFVERCCEGATPHKDFKSWDAKSALFGEGYEFTKKEYNSLVKHLLAQLPDVHIPKEEKA